MAIGKYPPTQQGIQDAVNSLKDVVDDEHTGIIHLAQGVYDIYSPIQLYPFITLSGEGKIDYDFNNRIPSIILKPDSLNALIQLRILFFTIMIL